MRRVAVTGLGLVTPLGAGVGHVWKRLVNGESGIQAIQAFDVSDLPCKIAGTVPVGESGNGHFDPDAVTDAKDRRKMDDFIVYTLGAAAEAVEDAGWQPEAEEDRERTGVLIGSGIGGLKFIFDGSITMNERGPRRVTPFFIPATLINLASGQVSIRYGFKGPNHSVVTACATGAHAIGDAARMIMLDDADVMVAGGAEAAVCRIGIAGFASARALSTGFNDTPERASRPWDRDRDGFVMGEGGATLILEREADAKARGAPILAYLVGYGCTNGTGGRTEPDGDAQVQTMKIALEMAGITAADVDAINPHMTSTVVGDRVEAAALREMFGDRPFVSATKSSTGHMLAAAGSFEAAACVKMLVEQRVPATINTETIGDDCAGINYVLGETISAPQEFVLSNSFGFGDHNATLVFQRAD